MISKNQNTIKKATIIKGIGLHSGAEVVVKLNPAEENTGIIFERTDKKINNIIKANYKNVVSSKLCTKLENEFKVSVSTVEHLLGAICGEEIDNVLVQVNGPEIPIMDGSAADFVNAIRKVGIERQKTKRQYIEILKKIKINEGSKFISIEPLKNNLNIDFEIVYKNSPLIKSQKKSFNIYKDNLNAVYNSRTFCLYEDIDKIKSMGLAKGGSLDNAIVVQNDKVLNKEGLRYKDEFVMHKILDCMGDLMLSKYRLFGSVVCTQGGHQLTNQLLKKIFSSTDNWKVILSQPQKPSFSEAIDVKQIAVNA